MSAINESDKQRNHYPYWSNSKILRGMCGNLPGGNKEKQPRNLVRFDVLLWCTYLTRTQENNTIRNTCINRCLPHWVSRHLSHGGMHVVNEATLREQWVHMDLPLELASSKLDANWNINVTIRLDPVHAWDTDYRHTEMKRQFLSFIRNKKQLSCIDYRSMRRNKINIEA